MAPLAPNEHTFESIVGQDLVKRFLLRASTQGRLPQALLFAGPEGVGKRSLMFSLTKHLVAREAKPGSDEEKRAHGKVERGTHPDVLVVSPRSASGQILREQIEEDRQALAILERGKFFGEMSLIDGSPRSATATAHEVNTRVLRISKERLEELLASASGGAIELLSILCRLLSGRLREINDKIVQWKYMSGGF